MPSRWERMVERATKNRPGSYGSVVIAKLLARQHARMVRMVKRLRTSQKFPPIMKNSWYQAACNDILAALAKEKGRKK